LIVLRIADLVAEGRSRVRAIWAEKPLAICLADADEMVRRCEDSGILLVTNTQRNSEASMQLARLMIDAGELGQMRQITATAQAGMAHNGVHLIAAMCLLAGGSRPFGQCVEWLTAELESDEKAETDEDFYAAAYLAFGNGVRGFIRNVPPFVSTQIEANGTKGSIVVRDFDGSGAMELWRHLPAVEGGLARAVRYDFPRPPRVYSGNVGQVLNIINCLETGGEPTTPGELGRHLLEIVLAMRESHRRGNARVNLPLVDRNATVVSHDASAGGVRSPLVGVVTRPTDVVADFSRQELERARISGLRNSVT
jgi:predicted dehydrogenase